MRNDYAGKIDEVLAAQDIQMAVHYPLWPNRKPACGKDQAAAEMVYGYWTANRFASLPMSVDLTKDKMGRMVAALCS